jgi:predicted esterase
MEDIVKAHSPHANGEIFTAGPEPEKATGTMVLLHGRNASAHDMIALHREINDQRFAAMAPQAALNTWYPNSFLAPLEANQPWLDSALERVESIVAELLSRKVESERIVVMGFSQGACLTLEFAARHPRRYGAIIGLTGGLIGPAGTPRKYAGSLSGTPVFLGSGDPDSHVPFERVRETEQVLKKMGATVELRRYAGMGHGINEDEIDACRKLLNLIADEPTGSGSP